MFDENSYFDTYHTQTEESKESKREYVQYYEKEIIQTNRVLDLNSDEEE